MWGLERKGSFDALPFLSTESLFRPSTQRTTSVASSKPSCKLKLGSSRWAVRSVSSQGHRAMAHRIRQDRGDPVFHPLSDRSAAPLSASSIGSSQPISSEGEILSWQALARLAAPPVDRVEGPASAQASLRLFGQEEEAVRVTLYRDHHAWCPYCQKVWLWLEERRIPYRVRKVTMHCYGTKEDWYRQLVPSGMLPALELDGQLITESDRILEALETSFGPLRLGMQEPRVVPLRRLERRLFVAWCQWLCRAGLERSADERAPLAFERVAEAMAEALAHSGGPFLLGQISTADVVFVPYLERMNASLTYYKGYRLRQRHPAIDSWFRALEERSSYLATQSDFHTHAHDLPPQMGGCYASGSAEQQRLARRIDRGPWPISDEGEPDPETSQSEPADAPAIALSRVLRHRGALLARYGCVDDMAPGAIALRCALTVLISERPLQPPGGTAMMLRSLARRSACRGTCPSMQQGD